jgi:UDP-N-acetylmuramoyl-tripeptide--D-alanyl-D-alanine ligase
MIALALDELAGLGVLVAAPGAHEVTGVTIDSRAVRPGDLFVAVGGGVAFVEAARAAGAAATLVPGDDHAALAAIGRAVLARSQARVIGVTGSNGKTSTKDILAALCGAVAPTVAAEKSFNNEIGVPLTLCRLEEATEVAVLEMAMRGPGQIAALCAIARPDVAVITSIAPAHLELLGSLRAIAAAKAEILAALPAGGIAVVPAGVPELEPLLLRRDDIAIRRTGPTSAYRVAEVQPGEGAGCRATFELAGRAVTLDLDFSSRHQLANTLSALAAYDALGLPLERAAEGAARIVLSSWRGEEHPLPGGGVIVNDAYNANPGSMRAALEHQALRAGGRRRLAILGTMAELGPTAPDLHREIGRLARDLGVDEVLAVGELGRHYLDEGPPGTWAPDAAAAVDAAAACIRPGDHVLVKASRSVGLERVADALRGF